MKKDISWDVKGSEVLIKAVARDLANQGFHYTEAFYSPPNFVGHGLQAQRITEVIRGRLNTVDRINIALVSDLLGDFGPEKAKITLEEINEVKELGVVGVGIGGSEHKFPPEQFESVFTRKSQRMPCVNLGFVQAPTQGKQQERRVFQAPPPIV